MNVWVVKNKIPEQVLLYAKYLTFLTLLAFIERMLFVFYNPKLAEQLSTGDLIFTALWGLRFDLAVATFVSLLVYILAFVQFRVLRFNFKTAFTVIGSIGACALIFLQAADIMYYVASNRHAGYEIFDFSNDSVELMSTAFSAFTQITLVHVFMMPVTVWLLRRWLRGSKPRSPHASSKRSPLVPELQLLVVVLVSVLCIRGGVTSLPQTPMYAQLLGDRNKTVLALNGAYNAIFYAASNHKIHPLAIAHAEAIEPDAIVSELYPASDGGGQNRRERKQSPNVIVVLLESWPAMYMRSYGYPKDVTPFFDALRERSLTTYGMMADGHRTTEGMFSVFCSAQNPLGQTVAQSQIQDYDYFCLPHLLQQHRYYTAFFQGTHKNTSGTGMFALSLGFQDSYGKRDIQQRQYPENSWGVHDPDLYRFVREKMQTMSKPFFVGINTNSTHDSSLPEGEARFNEAGIDPMINTMNFADRALKQFVTDIQLDKSLGPTILVLVADHTAFVQSSSYYTHSIPFLIFAPDLVAPKFVNRVASQRDIAPTLSQLLGIQGAKFAGKSLLRDDQAPYFADYFQNGWLGWIEGPRLIEVSLTQSDSIKCYNYRADPLLKNGENCGSDDQTLSRHALGFTMISQSQLFAGKLNQFIPQ